MANRKFDESVKMRELARMAVEQGITTPYDLAMYFKNNGWEGELPSFPTLKRLLEHNGIVYVSGVWVKAK